MSSLILVPYAAPAAAQVNRLETLCPLLWRIAKVFSNYRGHLLFVAILVLIPRLGDLLVPYFAARVFDALAANAAPQEVNILIVQAAAFWVLHGNFLPVICDWFTCRYFSLPAKQHISEYALGSALRGVPSKQRQELATMHQAVLEEGENKLIGFADTIVRTAIPVGIMSLCALAMILWWIPILGAILLIGGALDILATTYANRKLKHKFAKVQELTFERQRQHRNIFNNISRLISSQHGRDAAKEYSSRYTELTTFSTRTQGMFLSLRFGRTLILNVTDCLTWIVGAWCVYKGICSIGLFILIVTWSARANELFGLVTHLHKVWLDSMPAIRSFFEVIDHPAEALSATPATAPAQVKAIA